MQQSSTTATDAALPRQRERQDFRRLLEQNPNYFGQLPDSQLKPVEKISGDTSFEELKCIGLFPEKNTAEATIEVKRPYGYGGDLCGRPTREFVRFFLDWDNDGDFNDPGEDLGFASLEVHSLPEVVEERKETHLCYAVRLAFKPHLSTCEKPLIIKMRAVLAWEQIPTGPNFPVIWGNVLDCLVQIDPEGNMQVVSIPVPPAPDAATPPGVTSPGTTLTQAPPERTRFLELLAQNPNFFGGAPNAAGVAGQEKQFDTTFEELHCLGLFPEEDLLEAIFVVKLPFGFNGPLCAAGSHEFVRFFVDWNNDGDFNDPGEDLGFASVRVHDIPEVRPGDPRTYLCYATLRVAKPRIDSDCKTPLIRRARAVLSWQVPPPGPDGPVVWGNRIDCLVQFRPTRVPPPHPIAVITDPANNSCTLPAPVATCILDSQPLRGIAVHGSAEGGPFDHYTLTYTWPGHVTQEHEAVVYPNCVRAGTPTDPGSTTSVHNGLLGYLDVMKLPPTETVFTITLTTSPTAGASVSASATFELQRREVYIDAVATQVVVEDVVDPFHPLTPVTTLLKHASADAAEQSVGGAFSINGGADVDGCDRVIQQYLLKHYPAPPTAPVPVIPDAAAPCGTDINSPQVVYNDTPDHPYTHGCLFPLSNIILNGNLVAQWGFDCCFTGPPFTGLHCGPNFFDDPALKNNQPWDSNPLNGRFVLLLEVQDVPSGGVGPVQKTQYQVAAWIDNQTPVGKITSVGGTSGCSEIRLNDYKVDKAKFMGIAWDWPIDFSAPQQAPNDNFGEYSLDFVKNGGIPGGTIVTSANRVGTPAWGPAPPAIPGELASWDIVAALDAGPLPSPAPDPGVKLYRGTQCAYVFRLNVTDKTWVGDSGNHNDAPEFLAAFTIVNDIPDGDPFPEPAAS